MTRKSMVTAMEGASAVGILYGEDFLYSDFLREVKEEIQNSRLK